MGGQKITELCMGGWKITELCMGGRRITELSMGGRLSHVWVDRRLLLLTVGYSGVGFVTVLMLTDNPQ